MAARKTQKKTLEGALTRLEAIASKLELLDTPLEESLELYKEGVELSVFCAGVLETARQEVTVLQKTAEGLFERVLEPV